MADIYEQAAGLLEAVAARLGDPPDRRYVADGLPAFDCDQLTVHVAGFHRGTTQAERPTAPCAPSTVTAVVTRVWCVPTIESGRAPRTVDLERSGAAVTAGAQELWHATSAAAAALGCQPALIAGQPVAPSGGVVGWQITLQWTI